MASKKTSKAPATPAVVTAAPQPAPRKVAPKKATPAAPEIPGVVGSQQAYERFLPEARALDARDVRPFRADPSLAYHNIDSGVTAVLEREAQIAEELPKIDIARVRALPELALAVCFAAAQVDRDAPTSRGIEEKLGRARSRREIMLSSAVALAKAGVLPEPAVAKIARGSGAIDAAQDCVDLAALFTKHAAAVRGKTAVTAADVREAAALGTELLTLLKPKSAKRSRGAPAEVVSAAASRDRLWTLLAQQHRELRRAGMWLWAEEVDAHVPALQSRVAPAKTKKKPVGDSAPK
jgi:hypothetical protein